MKMPALLRYLPTLNHTHFAYVGSVYGSGAWAMATACMHLGYKCTLFISKSKHTPPWLSDIEKTGAILNWCDPLPVEAIHQNVTKAHPQIYNLPLGFDNPEFINDMAGILRESIPTPPPEIWVSTLSGVLTRATSLAFPNTPIHAVSAAKHVGDVATSTLHFAPEKFHQPALIQPPYPACPFSCAKVWQFAQKTAVSGAYILNVGYSSFRS